MRGWHHPPFTKHHAAFAAFQALLKPGYKPFGFFEPGILSLPMGMISFVLIISLGPMVLPDNKGGLFRQVREHGDNLVTALDITQEK